MKKLDLATVTASEIQAMKGSYPVATTIYRVATWYAPDRRWKIWQQEFPTYEKADEQGRYEVAGHTYYCVIPIELPGVKL